MVGKKITELLEIISSEEETSSPLQFCTDLDKPISNLSQL